MVQADLRVQSGLGQTPAAQAQGVAMHPQRQRRHLFKRVFKLLGQCHARIDRWVNDDATRIGLERVVQYFVGLAQVGQSQRDIAVGREHRQQTIVAIDGVLGAGKARLRQAQRDQAVARGHGGHKSGAHAAVGGPKTTRLRSRQGHGHDRLVF